MTGYLESLQLGLRGALSANQSVVLMGEDIADPYGGAFKVSKGLSTDFPERVLTTPISEGAITGMAGGMALRGFRPVVEIMFGDFLTLCTDQIVNHMAKFRGMFAERVTVPCVIRTPMGGGRGYGATHSQSLEKILLGTPDIAVIAPSHAHDPGAILKSAVLDTDRPVLFLEHKMLYPLDLLESNDLITVTHRDEAEGIPTAIVKTHAGNPDITIVSYGGAARLIVPVMERMVAEEINITAVLPGSLQPPPRGTIAEAAMQSGRVLIVEEGTEGFNWGAEIAALISEDAFGKLACPVKRLAGAAAIIPACETGERKALVGTADIEQAVLEVLE